MGKSTKKPGTQTEEYPDADQRRDNALRNALGMAPKPKKAKKGKKKRG